MEIFYFQILKQADVFETLPSKGHEIEKFQLTVSFLIQKKVDQMKAGFPFALNWYHDDLS